MTYPFHKIVSKSDKYINFVLHYSFRVLCTRLVREFDVVYGNVAPVTTSSGDSELHECRPCTDWNFNRLPYVLCNPTNGTKDKAASLALVDRISCCLYGNMHVLNDIKLEARTLQQYANEIYIQMEV